jgi:N4-gp56 family major capsid protein
MAQTTSAEVVIPEVHADMAQAQFLGSVRVAGSAAVLSSDALSGQPGETVTFPKWNALTELADLTETVPLVPEALGNSEMTATIKEAGKAVEVTDRARLVGLGDPLAEAARQFGVLAARKVDADLIAAAVAGLPAAFDVDAAAGQTTLSWDRIVQGIATFDDEWAPEDFAGIFINSAQHVELMGDATFLSADKVTASGLPVARGQVGSAAGVPVFVTDRVTAKDVLIVKRNALGLFYKQRPQVETDRDVLARSTVITTTQHYAVKRINDRGVARVQLAAS